MLLSERTRGNVASKLGSPPPCDSEFTKLSESQEILSFLAPLPLPPPVPDFTRPRFEPYPDPKGKGKGKKGKEPGKVAAPASFDIPEGAKTKDRGWKAAVFCIQQGEVLALQED